MDRRKATLGVALAGVVAGAVGLGFLAAPAGAGQSPTLPQTTPQALVQSVLSAKLPALAGTVQVDNNLGLPALPGLPQFGNGASQVRVWSDGTGKGRMSVPADNSEQTYVEDGTTAYQWDSATRTVTEHSAKAAGARAGAHDSAPAPEVATLNPATAAKDLVAAVQASSTVSVDGTDMVANRPAYDLVLTPKPNQRTLLREVKIAVDATAHIPLQITVLGNNSTSPALQIGFAKLDLGPQDPALFTFTPPAGATVVNGDKDVKKATTLADQAAPKLVGTAWDTVVIAQLPSQLAGSSAGQGQGSAKSDPMSLVRRFGTPVSGAWGSGWVVSTDIGTALITSDGRLAAGFVPQQVLIQALGAGK